jgi:hypothetical protein
MSNSRLSPGCTLTIIGLLIALFIVSCSGYRSSKTSVTATVTSKEVKRKDKDSDRYLIFTKEGETFEITDTAVFWRYNSSDVYGSIEPNHKYKLTVAGWRMQWFSSYRNILSAERLD